MTKYTLAVVCILFVSLWGLGACTKPSPVNPTPDAELQKFLFSLKNNDVAGAKQFMSSRVVRMLENMPSDSYWKDSALYSHAQEWNLDNSQIIWPILAKWAAAVEDEKVTWLTYRSTQEYLYPKFQEDESIGLLFAVQPDGGWAIDEIIVALAK